MGVALVTGGTSGIGAEFARQLAQRGHDLVLVARSQDRLAEMALELRSLGRSVEVLSADLGDRADVLRVAARIEDPERPIDILVNNAGFGVHAMLTDTDVSAHDHAFEVMGRAVLVLSGAAGRSMARRGTGTIINLSSTAAFFTMGSYSAIKTWVLSMTQGLSIELGGTGVQVTAFCPGWVRTEFHQRAGISSSSIPNFLWQDAESVVRACLHDVERGKVISIPSVRYRALIWLAHHAPKSLNRRVSSVLSSSRRKPVTQ